MTLRGSETAIQKYNLLVNGAKKEAEELFNLISNGKIGEAGLIRMNVKSKFPFFYKKCGEAYLIFAQETESWVFMDVLTKKEIKDMVKREVD